MLALSGYFPHSAMVAFMLLTGTTCALAQKTFRASGEAQIRVEDQMSKEQAKSEVRNQAIIKAIENELGTYVEQETNVNIREGQTNFTIFGSNKVKGEWLGTDKEEFSESTVRNKETKATEIWLTCKISGTVREIVKPKLKFNYSTLSCNKPNCRTTEFKNQEQLFFLFRSPSKGHLSIYALQEDQTAYRLLPYQEMKAPYENSVPVEADQEYIFFSPSKEHDYFNGFPVARVDEMVLETSAAVELMKLYIVFSTDPFTKPLLKSGQLIEQGSLPKSLGSAQFEEWIRDNRIHNPNFNYEILNVSIVKQ